MNNNTLFNDALVSRWFNVEKIDINTSEHRARVKTYRNVLDLDNGLIAWNGADAELISPFDAWPDQMAAFFRTTNFILSNPSTLMNKYDRI